MVLNHVQGLLNNPWFYCTWFRRSLQMVLRPCAMPPKQPMVLKPCMEKTISKSLLNEYYKTMGCLGDLERGFKTTCATNIFFADN